MNNKFVINFTPGPTTLHKLTGKTKVMWFLILTIAIIITFDIRVLALLAVPIFIGILSMKPNYKPLMFMMLFMLVTVFGIGTVMLFFASPQAGLQNVGYETILIRFTDRIYLSKEWLWYVFVYNFKRFVSFLSVMLFSLATTPSEFASGLAGIGVPYKICTVFSLAYRSIPDVANQFVNIKDSMQMRGLELGPKAPAFKKLKQYVLLLIPLILSTFSRVGTIANAMDLRGYGKKDKRTYYAEHELTKADKILRIVAIFMVIAIIGYYVYTRFVDPYPAVMWCPWVSRDMITVVEAKDPLMLLKWFIGLFSK